MLDIFGEFGIVFHKIGQGEEVVHLFGGLGNEDGVGKRGDAEVERAVLEGAVDFAGAAEFEVDFCEVEAVGGFF